MDSSMTTPARFAAAQPHWSEIAERWSLVGPPLRPSSEDLAVLRSEVLGGLPSLGRVLILGVTPELYGLGWPAGTRVTAVDRTAAMIEGVWPGPREDAVCGAWERLPLEDGSQDLVLCDGGLHLLDPDTQRVVAGEVRRVLAPEGVCAFRLFVPASPRETPALVLQAFLVGALESVNELKMRLAMAMQENAESGVCLDDVWCAVRGASPDPDAMAARLGWDARTLHALDSYRGCAARYHFVSTARATRVFGSAGLRHRATHTPRYRLGERCPTVVFDREGNN